MTNKSKPPSLWERKREAWHQDAARSEATGASMPLLWVFGTSAVMLLGFGFLNATQLSGQLSILAGAGCLVSLWGLWRCKDWARRGGGVVAGVLALASLVGTVMEFLQEGSSTAEDWVLGVGLMWLWAAIAFRLLGDGSRRLFDRARGEQKE